MANHAERIDARVTIVTLMLREDHQKLQQLFDQFHETTNTNEKRNIVTETLAALEVHATLEEELIYPTWRECLDEQDVMDEALEEHHVIHLLIKELKTMRPWDARYDAKFTVLSEHVKRHMKEEERKIFPRAEQVDLNWERLTKQVLQRRQSLEHKELWLFGMPVLFNARETACTTRAVLSGRSGD